MVLGRGPLQMKSGAWDVLSSKVTLLRSAWVELPGPEALR